MKNVNELNNTKYESENSSPVSFRLWSNYGKNRLYINREDGKKSYGYIDLDAQKLVCADDLKHKLEPIYAWLKENYNMEQQYQ